MKRVVLVAISLVALAMAFSAAAKPALKDNPTITNGLIAVGIALEIGEKCEDMSPRMLKGMAFLNDLKKTARREGYSDKEIDAFVDNKSEKKRLEAQARAYLASKGANGGDRATYCKVGEAEIAAGSQAGRLIRKH
ncbi:MAG: DUF5333 domain-containing protein [Pseudomonadota bacterium]